MHRTICIENMQSVKWIGQYLYKNMQRKFMNRIQCIESNVKNEMYVMQKIVCNAYNAIH